MFGIVFVYLRNIKHDWLYQLTLDQGSPKRDKLGKDGQGVPRTRDIMMQINFKVMKRSNIRVKQITISQELTVHNYSTSLEPYNFIKNIWPKILKFSN